MLLDNTDTFSSLFMTKNRVIKVKLKSRLLYVFQVYLHTDEWLYSQLKRR